jgi:DNA-binding response OmpR family regulator
MNLQVLVVEDYRPNRKSICEVVRSHSLTSVEVGDMASARERLLAGGIGFCILDLGIPADGDGGGARRENGRLLLQWMRKQAATAHLPVIVVTGEDKGDTEFAVSVVTAGGSEITQYLKKPLAGDKLDQKIIWAMERCGQAGAATKQPFVAEQRDLEVHEDKILFLGAEVWHETGQDYSVRDACAILSQRDQHGYVRQKGTALGATLKRGSTNHISTPMNRMLDVCVEVAASKGICCARRDLMSNKQGGYHFTEIMRVVVVGDWATALGVEPTPPQAATLPTGEPVAAQVSVATTRRTERQQRIQELRSAHPTLSLEQIAKRLKVSRSTVVREVKGMSPAATGSS